MDREIDDLTITSLKPCPFCGASAHIWFREDTCLKGTVRYMAVVECNNMFCEALIDTPWSLNKEDVLQDAIKCWNRRVE